MGEAVSTCTIRVEAHDWLMGQALRPEALPKIQALEEQRVHEMPEEEDAFESPVFITHLNNVECREGETAHFECRVQPSKDPTMQIEWYFFPVLYSMFLKNNGNTDRLAKKKYLNS